MVKTVISREIVRSTTPVWRELVVEEEEVGVSIKISAVDLDRATFDHYPLAVVGMVLHLAVAEVEDFKEVDAEEEVEEDVAVGSNRSGQSASHSGHNRIDYL